MKFIVNFLRVAVLAALFGVGTAQAAVVWANTSFRQAVTAAGSVSNNVAAYQSTLTVTSVNLGQAERSTDGGTTWQSYSSNVWTGSVYCYAYVSGGQYDGHSLAGPALSQGQTSTVSWYGYTGATGVRWEIWLSYKGQPEPYSYQLWSSAGGGAPVYLPQRKLSWTVTNSNTPPATSANLQTWAVFQFTGTEPTGIAFAHRTLEAGQSATLTIYVAQDDTYNYAPGRVDYKLSSDTYGGFPSSGTAYGLNADGTTNYSDPQFTYMEGALPVAGSTGTVGNYGNATKVTEIPTGTTGPGVNNTTPVVTTPTPSTGGTVTVTPGSGGTTTSTDTGTASAIQQGSNAIIQAVNNTGQTTRQAIDRNTAAVNAGNAAIVQALNGFDGSGIQGAVEAGNAADAAARQAEQTARQGIESAATEGAIGSDVATRDAQLGAKDAQATSLFSNVGGGMTGSKVTPTVASGDPSAWEFDLGVLGTLDINPFTNAWVQEKLPFLNWLVAFFRLAVVWSAQVAFYRWLVNTIRENAVAFMHTPSPPPTVVEGVASSNPFTAILGKLGAVFSSLFLAVLILSSLSTIVSVVTTWGTVSSLVNSITEGTNALSSASTGLGATSGYLGRIVYLVTSYIPVSALLGIGANYVIIETGLVATMPVLIFSMRIRRW